MMLSDWVVSLFRQHHWENKYPGGRTPWNLPDITCVRCGKSYPIPKEHIDMGWWQGGCRGEKQLLINELERSNGK